MTKEEKAANRNLLKKYGRTLEEYNARLAEQNGRCKICGKLPTGRRLHLDHDHSVVHFKVKATKLKEGWMAETNDKINRVSLGFREIRKTKSEAIKAVKHLLLLASWRAIACWRCNAMLRWGQDNPNILRSAANYLEEYNKKLTEIGEANAARA